MTTFRTMPAQLRWTLLLGLLGLAVTVPFSSPDGTGMQWDELVLGSIALSCASLASRRLWQMDRNAARPWWPLLFGSVSFAVSQFLAGLFPGPAFDGFGADDVLLFLGATSPLVTCFLLARRVMRTRWTALLVDGALVTLALLVVTEVLRTPLVNPADAPEDLRTLVLAYGGYSAVMLGGAGALCTVSTRAMRSAVTTLIFAVTAQAAAGACEAMAILAPSPLWTAGSDVSVALAFQLAILALLRSPVRFTDRSARASAPVISSAGLSLVVLAMLSLPAALAYALLADEPLSVGAELGCGAIFVLLGIRQVLRIREDGRLTEDLVRSEEDFRELVEASSDGIAIIDGDFQLLFTSPAARRLLGIGADLDDGVTLLDLVRPEDRAALRAAGEEPATGTGPAIHLGVTAEDGTARELEVASSERPGSGRRVLYLRDVTTRRRRERELERMAYTDDLTRLPNRAVLFQELAADSAAPRCLLVLDMDGFKQVNDGAGHEAGDQLLVEVARRLRTVVRDSDVIARLGGDEFAVVVTGDLDEAADVAGRIVQIMGLPYRVEGRTYAVGASVGLAEVGPGGGRLAFRKADAALLAAKAAGKGCVRIADAEEAAPDTDVFYAARAEGEMGLRLDAAVGPDGSVELLHALPRWTHPTLGVLQGPDIWSSAERHGRSAELQRWLIERAASAVVALPDPRVAVAVSLPAGHVSGDGLASAVATTLADTGLAPARLIVSLTEETLLTSPATLVAELEAMRRLGVRLCLDDYGMGHSLFALLARVPFDLIRVDLHALAARQDTERALRVLAAIVQTTASFGLDVVAGGIATPELREAAVATGVQLLHGRALPHDLTPETATDLLALAPVSAS
ncbi:EAL domain-containing protein [Blastococcus sp. CCUG 61487]|uniref:EAL domain-containing protein n=1 Tax=Blastococcus sp. CCUG 61487 TaxID=1840703 RepID=UPI0010BFB457|nr:EAL domain-containing protein [Blastococcus sp. CCUG 61487]TKJ23146.1 hypothetical protein A6V29_05660 [Blastococcus sp. CCUG 61487]